MNHVNDKLSMAACCIGIRAMGTAKTRQEREKPASSCNSADAHPGMVIWLTGLSGSGKTTTGRTLEKLLREKGYKVELLDGDELRRTISSELGFSKEDREIHAKRVAYLSDLLSRNGIITIVALISPFRAFRKYARDLVRNFVEVWIQCSLETCVKRDPKGLYRNASKGELKNMTGVQQAYEPPLDPEVTVNTEKENPEQCAIRIMDYVSRRYANTNSVFQ